MSLLQAFIVSKLIGSGGGGGTGITDVQINGTSIVSGDVANVPVMGSDVFGVAKLSHAAGAYGLTIGSNDTANTLIINPASSAEIKLASAAFKPISPSQQHNSVFYGLAKAAGDSTQSASSNTVGTYTETAKSKISDMLHAPESVTGTTPAITALPGVRYICGECSTLDITLPASGIVDVIFESGSTPTVLTVTPPTGMTMKWPAWFDATTLEANKTYEINILDGIYGTVTSWT